MSTRVWAAAAIAYGLAWAWITVDLWTGMLGNLHRDARFGVYAVLVVGGLTAIAVWLVAQIFHRLRRGEWAIQWPFPRAVVAITIIVTVIPGPPLGLSKDELEQTARETTLQGGENFAADYRPGTRRIGSIDVKRIRQFGDEIYFEQLVPDGGWTGKGLVWKAEGEPEKLYDWFEHLEMEPQGDGWFSYEGSL